jgi:hypothetical protein
MKKIVECFFFTRQTSYLPLRSRLQRTRTSQHAEALILLGPTWLLLGWIQRGSHNPINDAQVTGVHDSRCLQLPSHLNIAWCFNCSCGVVSVPLLPLSIYVMCQLFYNKSCASVTSVIVGRTVVGVREMQTLITCSCIVLNACIYIHASLSLEASFCFLKR